MCFFFSHKNCIKDRKKQKFLNLLLLFLFKTGDGDDDGTAGSSAAATKMWINYPIETYHFSEIFKWCHKNRYDSKNCISI